MTYQLALKVSNKSNKKIRKDVCGIIVTDMDISLVKRGHSVHTTWQ